MSSYSNHIKKMTAILLAPDRNNPPIIETESMEIKRVIKRKKVINKLPKLTDIEKNDINNVNDFHEFIEGPKLHDDSEE